MRTTVMLLLGLALVAPAALPVALADPAPPGRAAESHTLTVTNRSDHTITELRVSGAREDDWGNDRLGAAETIEPGSAFTVRLPGSDCAYDVQVKYDNGRLEERRGVDVCRTRQLAMDGSAAVTPPAAAAPPAGRTATSATLLNATTRTITEVYVSPASADHWGDDRLGRDQLPTTRSLSVAFTGGCRQDVRVVYDNRSAEERHGVDLCAHTALRIAPGWTLLAELDAPAGTGEDGGQRGSGGHGPGGGQGGGGGQGDGNGGDAGGDHIRYLVPAAP